MKLLVKREIPTTTSTRGLMFMDGVFLAYSLELPLKYGQPGSAIPSGAYKVGTYQSPHFGRLMPLIEGIPGRSEIEIHYGNYPTETRGCILIGSSQGPDFVGGSLAAFNDFWAKAQGAMEAGECFIEIVLDIINP